VQGEVAVEEWGKVSEAENALYEGALRDESGIGMAAPQLPPLYPWLVAVYLNVLTKCGQL